MSESKPTVAGTYYGQLSSGGHWIWRGVGSPDDAWVAIEQPKPKEPPKPEQYAKPSVATWMLYVMNPVDATYLLDSSAKTNYRHGHYLVMNPADAARIT